MSILYYTILYLSVVGGGSSVRRRYIATVCLEMEGDVVKTIHSSMGGRCKSVV